MALTPEQQKALDDSYKVTAEAERVLAESLAESAANDSNLGDEGDDPENLVIETAGSTTASDYYEGTDKEVTEAEAQAIRDAQRARMQNQIDTITNNYSDYVANIKQKGEEDATRTSLISGASGLLGSPRATTQIDRTKQLTQDQVDASNAQRDLKIQAVKDKGDAIAELKIEAERTKATGNTEDYLTYLDKVQTDSRANWAALAQAGLHSIEDIKLASTEGGQSGDYYKQMLEDTGWNELMLDSMFNASLPKAEQVDYNYTWKGNNLVVTSVGSDGTLSVDTYTADDLGIPTGTNVKFITDVPSGEMFWYDEDNPLDENGNLKTTKLEGISAGVPGDEGSEYFADAIDENWDTIRSAMINASKRSSSTERKDDAIRFEELMDKGDVEGAKDYMIRTINSNSVAATRAQIIGRNDTIDALGTIKKEIGEYIDNDGSMNIFAGTEQDVLGKIGKMKDEKIQSIATKIATALFTYRRSMTGAQFSDKESSAYEAIYPNIMNEFNVNESKIDGLIEAYQASQVSFYKGEIGELYYDKLFGGGSTTTESTSDVDDYLNSL